MMKRTSLLVLVLEGPIGLQPFNISLFGINCWGIDLDYCDVELFALEMNWNHSAFFLEIAPKYCISDAFIEYEGYSI